jgi:type VI secretion system secreted protein Hcp
MPGMAERWFLKIDGIPGESTDERHRNEIEVLSWSFGLSTTVSRPGTGTGAGTGRPTFEDLQVEATVSAATPLLFKACAAGTHVRTAVLAGVRAAGANPLEFLTISLQDVLVTSAHQADSEAGVPTDHVALRYAKVTVSYQPQSPTGAALPAVVAGWDVRANHAL